MGYSPFDIILVGDSADGNLAFARYLVKNRTAPDMMPPAPPRHLILLSPWTDLSSSHHWPGSSTLSNTDYTGFHDSGRSLHSKAFLGPFRLGLAFYSPYISKACFLDWVRHTGTFRRLSPNISRDGFSHTIQPKPWRERWKVR